MEILSILNPPFVDIINDPRLTSAKLLKQINEQERIITQQVKGWGEMVKAGDVKPFDLMQFACIQQHMHVATLHTQLAARSVDLGYGVLHARRLLLHGLNMNVA